MHPKYIGSDCTINHKTVSMSMENATRICCDQPDACPDLVCSGIYEYDVCLITLKTEIQFNENVTNIDLNRDEVLPSTECTVSGWGSIKVNRISINQRNV